MHRSGAGDALLVGSGLPLVERSAVLTLHLPAGVAARLEAERLLQQLATALHVGGVHAHAAESLQRQLVGDVGVLGHQRLIGAGEQLQLQAQALGIVEAQAALGTRGHGALVAQPLLPEVQSLLRPDPPHDRADHPAAGPAGAGARVLEEGDVRPGAAALVGVEEVIDGGVVLVDRLLDHSQAQHPRVEVDVARCVGGDARNVVDAVELHWRAPCLCARPLW
jgi:hypothetical protein